MYSVRHKIALTDSLCSDVNSKSQITVQVTEKHRLTRDRVGEAKYLVAAVANNETMIIGTSIISTPLSIPLKPLCLSY
jgi:hypothetical protein